MCEREENQRVEHEVRGVENGAFKKKKKTDRTKREAEAQQRTKPANRGELLPRMDSLEDGVASGPPDMFQRAGGTRRHV